MISVLENLPYSLFILDIRDTVISKIQNLPNTLHSLDMVGTRIQVIENLPMTLRWIDYDEDFNGSVDNIPASSINFKIHGYNGIKRIQKRVKKLYNEQRIIISYTLHDWIWKPLCNDGTIGLRPRLDTEFLGLAFA
jgi:hypothetical protein